MSERHNLARAWRSKTFDEVVGQGLTVRILKNSLYRRHLFPVYLLAGQRGCGKTTVGRLLAAAINCAQYEDFCARPREVVIPCAQCASCVQIRQGAHPDCVEIDAASHTGVDHVRSLIDSATFLPVLGRKKVYLIDEVHMLSKAAFNALLKVLEEPPASVIFILATTDPHKVLETVRSRCFHLFFMPVEQDTLVAHLARVCTAEKIEYDEEGLRLIAYESEGSVRDALNAVERVFLAYESVTYTHARAALGDVGAEVVCTLCIMALTGLPGDALRLLEQELPEGASLPRVWSRSIEMLRLFLLARVGVPCPLLTADQKAAVGALATERITYALECFYELEPLLAKTSNQRALFELALLRCAAQAETGGVPVTRSAPIEPSNKREVRQELPSPPLPDPVVLSADDAWSQFIARIKQHDDPLVFSIMRQGEVVEKRGQEIVVCFAEHLAFFKETVESTREVWGVHAAAVWGQGVQFVFQFTRPLPGPRVQEVAVPLKLAPEKEIRTVPAPVVRQGIDIRNKEQWPLVHQVLAVFPGTVSEDTGDKYE